MDTNPWWVAAARGTDPLRWLSSHRVFRDRQGYDLGYRPAILADVGSGPLTDQLIVLAGPRRVGKSAAVLDLAVNFCSRTDIDPRQVIHLPCDGMQDRDLRRSLTLARELTRIIDHPTPRLRVWLIDEITSVPGWTSILKLARDSSEFGDDTVVATGSRWVEGERVASSLLAGRAGKSSGRRVRHLLPMGFADFIKVTRPELPTLIPVHPSELQSSQVKLQLAQITFDVDAYDLAWQDYLTCGGFPRAVAEHVKQGAVSRSFARDLGYWLHADVEPEGPVESIPRLLAELTARSTSPLNVTHTATELNYPSRAIFVKRLEQLTASFAALTCPQRKDRAVLVPGSQAKIYLTDPLLAWLPTLVQSRFSAPEFPKLSEMALGVALARSIEGLEEGRWVAGDTIGYERTGSGNEIDFCPLFVPGSFTRKSTPIESKWVDARWRSETRVLNGRYSSGVVATKSILDLESNIWAIPAPLVALLLSAGPVI